MLSILLFALTALQGAPSLGIERYEVDPRSSTIGFDGTSTLHDFTGKTHAITAELRADRNDPGRLVGGAIWIEARTLDTDNKSRDKEMCELLDVKHYPQIVFQLDSVQGTLAHGKGEFTAQGRFTIKGVEKPRVVKFHIDPLPPGRDGTAQGMRVQGEVTFKMTDHGIECPGFLITKVGDKVRVWLDLTLRPIADAGTEAFARTLQIDEEFVPNGSGASVRKRSGTEYVWRAESNRLWERRLDPAWALKDSRGLVSVDPRTGRTEPPSELIKQAFDQLAKPDISGTTWTTTVAELDGRRTLRITFGAEVPARIPAWAFDPQSWSNGPEAKR